MPPDPSFDDLMARLRTGDEAAAAEVFHRFTGRLIGLARRRLDHLVRPKVDAEDILQSVYRSFFRRSAGGRSCGKRTGGCPRRPPWGGRGGRAGGGLAR